MKNKGQDRVTRVLNWITLLVIAAGTVYLIARYHALPAKIPGRFDASGTITEYRSKSSLVVLPVMNWLLYGFVTLVEKFPELYHISDSMDEGQDKISAIIRQMMGVLKLAAVAGISYIMIASMAGRGIGVWFLPVFLAALILPLIIMVLRIQRAGRG